LILCGDFCSSNLLLRHKNTFGPNSVALYSIHMTNMDSKIIPELSTFFSTMFDKV
jgi:hypothetical protein